MKISKRNGITAAVVAMIVVSGAWLLLLRGQHSSQETAANSAKQKVLYYQSPMHPWVKSDKPGRCTVCGMELVPVYEGAQPIQAATDVVMLPAGAPNVAGLKTVEARRQPLARKLRVAGTIEDDESRHRILSAYTGGRVEKLFVNYEGAEVQQGQPLATFYSKDLISAIREYKVAFGQGPSPMLTAARMRLTQLGMSEDADRHCAQTQRDGHLHQHPLSRHRHGCKALRLRGPICAGRRKALRARRLREDVVSVHRLRAGPAIFESRSERKCADSGATGQIFPGPNHFH